VADEAEPKAAPAPTDGVAKPAEPATPRTKDFAFPTTDALGKLPENIGLAVGTTVNVGDIQNSYGQKVMLGDMLSGQKSLIVFYRGGWCPYCNTQLRSLTQAHAWFKDRGINVVAISVDTPEEAATSKASWQIPFTLLSDPTLVAHKAFNVAFTIPEDEVERLKGFKIDVEASSGQTHHTVAVPSIFLIDAAGVIRWAHAELDYKTRPSVAQIQAVADQMFPATP